MVTITVGPPGGRVTIPLDGVTALVGENDAGKSTLLRLAFDGFSELHSPSGGADAAYTNPEIAFRVPKGRLLHALGDATDDDVDRLLQEHPAAWCASHDGDADVHMVIRNDRGPRLWLAAPAGTVQSTPDLAAAARDRGIDVAAYPDWCPVPIRDITAPSSATLTRLLPRALQLPSTQESLDALLAYAVSQLLDAFTDIWRAQVEGALQPLGVSGAFDDQVRYLEHWMARHQADRWLLPCLDLCDGQEEVHFGLEAATEIVTLLINRSMPGFVAHYSAVAVPTPLSTWIRSGTRVWLGLRRAGMPEPVPVNELADGLKLWVHLAATEGCAAAVTLADWIGEAFGPMERSAGGWKGAEPWLADIEPITGSLQAFGLLRDRPAEEDPEPVLDHLEGLVRGCSPFVESRGIDDLFRQQRMLYILDEPERHLHPRLQREAARWLTERAHATASPYLLATHSVPFMALASSARFLHVSRRRDGVPMLEQLDPRTLSAADAVASELGLDRGELLAFVTHIVFVEGITDRAFLEALYGPELRSAGTLILPLGGAAKAGSVIPMSELLLRYTTATVTVILDDLLQSTVESLRNDADIRREAARSKKVELRELARLVQSALELERDITATAISTKDIFDLIDEDVVREHLQDPRKVTFPGHAQARAQVGDKKWKIVYAERYGIDILNERTFGDGGAEMRRRSLRVAEVERLLDLSLTPDP